ncbi:MAG TPA: zinc-binding dehydrogenase [Solirubrobacteraceae bacterium]
MRAVVITKHGDFSVLQVQERPAPALGPDQVRIKVHAAGVNFADTMARVGLYPDAPKPPCVVGYEVAGEIIEGADTGARVIAGTRFGGYADEVVVDARDTFALPDDLSYEQGAAIPVNYVTAYAALIRYGNVQRGERVLLHAAAGGVGIAATQIAKHLGAEVWGTASPGKHDRIRANGVDHAVTYDARDLPQFDLVMDAIGGPSFKRSYKHLNPGGRLIAFGASAVMSGEKRDLVTAAKAALRMPRFNLIKQMQESKAVIGLNALTLWDHAGTLAPWMEPLRELLDAGVIQPVVSDAVPFDNAGEAHRIIAERRNVGKVVLVP